MRDYKKFANLDEHFMLNEYPNLSVEYKTSLWWRLLVYDMIFGSDEYALDQFTPENYLKWKSIEKDIDKYIELLMDEIIEHGPWSKEATEEYIREVINKSLGKKNIV